MRFFSVIKSRFQSHFLMRRSNLEVYTDGSCKAGVGSWAYVVACGRYVLREDSGRTDNTSSLAMEIKAATEVLKAVTPHRFLTIYSDCKILVDAMSGRANLVQIGHDRYSEVRRLAERHSISWVWIKGHAGHPMNERCDFLCKNARSEKVAESRSMN